MLIVIYQTDWKDENGIERQFRVLEGDEIDFIMWATLRTKQGWKVVHTSWKGPRQRVYFLRKNRKRRAKRSIGCKACRGDTSLYVGDDGCPGEDS